MILPSHLTHLVSLTLCTRQANMDTVGTFEMAAVMAGEHIHKVYLRTGVRLGLGYKRIGVI